MKKLIAILLASLIAAPAFAQGPVKSGPYYSAGASQFGLAVTTATVLTVPPGAICARISVSTAAVRLTADGSSPTSSVGFPIASGVQWTDCGPLASYKFTAQTGSPVLDVEYFK